MLLFILSNVNSIYAVLAMYMLYVSDDALFSYDACDNIAMLVTDCDICCSDMLGYLLCCNDEPMSFDCCWVARFDSMSTPMRFSFSMDFVLIWSWIEVRLKNFLYIYLGKIRSRFLEKKSYTPVGKYAPRFQITRFTPPRTTSRCIKIHRRA